MEVLQMGHIGNIRGGVDLKGIVSSSIFKQSKHGIEEISGDT